MQFLRLFSNTLHSSYMRLKPMIEVAPGEDQGILPTLEHKYLVTVLSGEIWQSDDVMKLKTAFQNHFCPTALLSEDLWFYTASPLNTLKPWRIKGLCVHVLFETSLIVLWCKQKFSEHARNLSYLCGFKLTRWCNFALF